jgi:hypothetical protein
VTIPVTVSNVAPTLHVDATDPHLNEGDTFTRSGSFTDPGAETWTATVDYGDAQPSASDNGDDGSGSTQRLMLNGKSFELNHTYLRDGHYTVTVSVTDSATPAATTSMTIPVTVNNVAPKLQLGGDAKIALNQRLLRSGSFTDPGADTWTATADYGDGSAAQPLTLAGKSFTLDHVYRHVGHYTATVSISDGTAQTTESFTVNVPSPRFIAVGADAGGAPRVKVFNADGSLRFDILAYNPAFHGGVRVALGDINHDGVDDIITACGPGGRPYVRGFDGQTGAVIKNFLAYSPKYSAESPSPRPTSMATATPTSSPRPTRFAKSRFSTAAPAPSSDNSSWIGAPPPAGLHRAPCNSLPPTSTTTACRTSSPPMVPARARSCRSSAAATLP